MSIPLSDGLFFRRPRAMVRLAVLTVLALPPPALAVTMPSEVEPSRIQPGVEAPPEPSLGAPEGALPALPARPPLPPATQKVHFVLKAVVIEGATVYTQAQLKPLYANDLGKSIPISEAEAIANRISARYRSDGYVLSQAILPRQDVRSGTLHIRVAEGFVDRVIIEGDEGGDTRGLLEEYGTHIASERPLTIDTLERYLLLMNDLPGITARSTLKPSPDTFGAADLVVTVTRKPWDASLSADNRLTRYLGSFQQTALLAENSLAGLDERTQVQVGSAVPIRAMRLFNVQHQEQLDSDGTQLTVNASQTRTQPGLTLSALDMESIADDLQFTIQHPFIRLRSETLATRVTFDYNNTDTTVLGGTPLNDDHVRALRLGGNYTFADPWQGTNLIDMQASRGLDLFDADVPITVRSQPAAPVNYTKLDVNASRIQPLPDNFSLFGAVSAQAAADPLLAAEQFSLGGAAFGSAYDPGALAGDNGAAVRTELRHDYAISGPLPITYQAYGFYDLGGIWDKTKTPDKSSLASGGVGLRFNIMPHVSGSTEMAIPLTRNAGLLINDHTPRLFFSLQATW